MYAATPLLYAPLGARATNQSVEVGQTNCVWLDLLLDSAGHFWEGSIEVEDSQLRGAFVHSISL